jgi:hypothetical protein
VVKNMMPSQTESSAVMKHRSIIVSRRVNDWVWNGNIHSHTARKKFRSQASLGKLIFTVFWDLNTRCWNIVRRGAQ